MREMPGFSHRARFPPERMLIYYSYASMNHVDFLSTAVIASFLCLYLVFSGAARSVVLVLLNLIVWVWI